MARALTGKSLCLSIGFYDDALLACFRLPHVMQ